MRVASYQSVGNRYDSRPSLERPPRVSVLMSVYNGQKYLRDAIESILNQTFRDFEFIIIDDGSTDGSWGILLEYAEPDDRIILLRNKNNVGLPKSLNIGLRIARGEYIARMDADDISLPERLATQVEVLDRSPNVGVVGSYVQLLGPDGKLGAVRRFATTHALILWALCFSTPLCHPATMARRSILLKVGGYDEDFRQSQDRDLWQRVSDIAALANVPEVLLLHRKHPDSISRSLSREQAINSAKARQRFISRVLDVEVPMEVPQAFKAGRVDSPGTAAIYIQVIVQLYKKFAGELCVSAFEKRVLLDDAADRVAQLVVDFKTSPVVWKELFRLDDTLSLLLYFLVARRILFKGIRSLLRRYCRRVASRLFDTQKLFG